MSWYLVIKNQGGRVPQKAMRVLRRFAKFAKIDTDLHAVSHKHGKMGNKPHKNSTAGWPTRVLRTFSKIAVGGGYRAIVMELTVCKG